MKLLIIRNNVVRLYTQTDLADALKVNRGSMQFKQETGEIPRPERHIGRRWYYTEEAFKRIVELLTKEEAVVAQE